MTTATKSRAYRPTTTGQLRGQLEEAREEVAMLQAALSHIYAFTTVVWEATQPDPAPTYSPSFRRRSA